MLLTLAFRHLWVRKLRTLFLLLGFSLGVGVMVVLLSVLGGGLGLLLAVRGTRFVGGLHHLFQRKCVERPAGIVARGSGPRAPRSVPAIAPRRPAPRRARAAVGSESGAGAV